MLGLRQTCCGRTIAGAPCTATPQGENGSCFWHDPDQAEAAKDARRLGGQRRRRERVMAGAYDFDGLTTVTALQRLVEVAALDTLGLENSIARARTLGGLAQVAAKLLEVGALEGRLQALEGALHMRPAQLRAVNAKAAR